MNEQLVLGVDGTEPYAARRAREMRESLALDASALDVGEERNLVYPGPRGDWGFPVCEALGCRREAIGPFDYYCYAHYSAPDEELGL